MTYECEECGRALPPGSLACPKCGNSFDEAVPHDAELGKRGWQAKTENELPASSTSSGSTTFPFKCARCQALLAVGSHSCAGCGLVFASPVPPLPKSALVGIPLQQPPDFTAPVSANLAPSTPPRSASNNQVKHMLWAVAGTILSGFIGGRIFYIQIGDRVNGDIEVGAILGLLGVAIAFAIASLKMRPFSLSHFKVLWIACVILYPISLYVGFNTAASAAKNAMLSRFDEQGFQQSFYNQYGRDATPEEIDQLKQNALSVMGGFENSDFGGLEKQGLARQIFWGPFFISVFAGCILMWKKRSSRTICQHCGNSVTKTAVFCNRCGHSIQTKPQVPIQ